MITWCCFNLRILSSIQSVVNLRSSWEIWLTELNFCSEGFSQISFSYFSFVAFSYFSKGNWIWLTQIIRAYPGHNPPTFSCPCLSWKGGSREQVCVYRVQRTWKMTQFRIRKFKTDTDTLSDTKNFRNRYRYFFRYQNFSKPIPILFSIPKIFETDTDTFFDTKIFRNRYRYHQKKWKSFETEKFRNRNVTLWYSTTCSGLWMLDRSQFWFLPWALSSLSG